MIGKVMPLLMAIIILLGYQGACKPKSRPIPVSSSEVEVFFSPHGGCTEAIVAALGEAKSSVLIQAYSFTSAPIAKAIVEAHDRGVHIEAILDKSQRTEQYSEADFLSHAGIRVLIDSKHQIAHNKIMIIDSNTVITGSFNFTKAAEEHNAENLLIIRNKDLAARYIDNWKTHAEHSEPYARGERKGSGTFVGKGRRESPPRAGRKRANDDSPLRERNGSRYVPARDSEDMAQTRLRREPVGWAVPCALTREVQHGMAFASP